MENIINEPLLAKESDANTEAKTMNSNDSLDTALKTNNKFSRNTLQNLLAEETALDIPRPRKHVFFCPTRDSMHLITNHFITNTLGLPLEEVYIHNKYYIIVNGIPISISSVDDLEISDERSLRNTGALLTTLFTVKIATMEEFVGLLTYMHQKNDLEIFSYANRGYLYKLRLANDTIYEKDRVEYTIALDCIAPFITIVKNITEAEYEENKVADFSEDITHYENATFVDLFEIFINKILDILKDTKGQINPKLVPELLLSD